MSFLDLARPATVSRPRPTLRQRLALWRSRRALAALDARALDDIGLSAREALTEAQKRFWDVPATWIDR